MRWLIPKPPRMSEREYWTAAAIGSVIGLALSGYFLVYAPMRANFERNGCVWLHCDPRP